MSKLSQLLQTLPTPSRAFMPIPERNTITIPAKSIIADNSHIRKDEVKLLCSFSERLIVKLRSGTLQVKDLDLFFTTVQHAFYLEQILPDYTFQNIREIVQNVIEKQFLPNLINNGGIFETDPAKENTLIKLHYMHRDGIIKFQQLFVKELTAELLQRRINDGRQRYAQILDEGLVNFRLYVGLLPEWWRGLVNLKQFAVNNNTFRAHKDLQTQLNCDRISTAK